MKLKKQIFLSLFLFSIFSYNSSLGQSINALIIEEEGNGGDCEDTWIKFIKIYIAPSPTCPYDDFQMGDETFSLSSNGFPSMKIKAILHSGEDTPDFCSGYFIASELVGDVFIKDRENPGLYSNGITIDLSDFEPSACSGIIGEGGNQILIEGGYVNFNVAFGLMEDTETCICYAYDECLWYDTGNNLEIDEDFVQGGCLYQEYLSEEGYCCEDNSGNTLIGLPDDDPRSEFEDLIGSKKRNQSFIIPNPFSNTFNLHLDSRLKNPIIKIFDLSGQLVFSTRKVSIGSTETINLNNLQDGMYLCKIIEKNSVESIKIIKTNN